MKHRHININNSQWNVAVVHSIWERGLEKDIRALIREVKRNDKGGRSKKGYTTFERIWVAEIL
jgi:hypothetical protein